MELQDWQKEILERESQVINKLREIYPAKTLKGLPVDDIEVDGIDTSDYPDFSDAYICGASVLEDGEWRDATDDELDDLNKDYGLVYEQVLNYIF